MSRWSRGGAEVEQTAQTLAAVLGPSSRDFCSSFRASICRVSMGRTVRKRSSRPTASSTCGAAQSAWLCWPVGGGAHLEFLLVGGADHGGHHVRKRLPGKAVQEPLQLGHHWDGHVQDPKQLRDSRAAQGQTRTRTGEGGTDRIRAPGTRSPGSRGPGTRGPGTADQAAVAQDEELKLATLPTRQVTHGGLSVFDERTCGSLWDLLGYRLHRCWINGWKA